MHGQFILGRGHLWQESPVNSTTPRPVCLGHNPYTQRFRVLNMEAIILHKALLESYCYILGSKAYSTSTNTFAQEFSAFLAQLPILETSTTYLRFPFYTLQIVSRRHSFGCFLSKSCFVHFQLEQWSHDRAHVWGRV